MPLVLPLASLLRASASRRVVEVRAAALSARSPLSVDGRRRALDVGGRVGDDDVHRDRAGDTDARPARARGGVRRGDGRVRGRRLDRRASCRQRQAAADIGRRRLNDDVHRDGDADAGLLVGDIRGLCIRRRRAAVVGRVRHRAELEKVFVAARAALIDAVPDRVRGRAPGQPDRLVRAVGRLARLGARCALVHAGDRVAGGRGAGAAGDTRERVPGNAAEVAERARADLDDAAARVEGAPVDDVQLSGAQVVGPRRGRAPVAAGVQGADAVVVGRPVGERAARAGREGRRAGRELHVAGVGGGGAARGRAGMDFDRTRAHVDGVVVRAVAVRVDVRLRGRVENGDGERGGDVLVAVGGLRLSVRCVSRRSRPPRCRLRRWSRRRSGCWRSVWPVESVPSAPPGLALPVVGLASLVSAWTVRLFAWTASRSCCRRKPRSR